jgi:solute carrier family 13 (sodium-dependent dicarboxylate transporter), member 2/3/5
MAARVPAIALSAILALLAFAAPTGLEAKAQAVLAISVFTGVMWFTEAIPLHATALLATALLIFAGTQPKDAFSPYFAPTIVLFFGGFVVARALEKHGLDQQIARRFLSRFGQDPALFLLGLMCVTAFLSLWMANTAATAIMLPVTLYVIRKGKMQKLKSNYAKSLVLAISFASTIGGIGTIVGTPPNGITVADLAAEGVHVPFFEWSYMAMPFVLLFLPVAWIILLRVFPPEVKKIELDGGKEPYSREQKLVLAVSLLTIAAWVSVSLHGVADATVAVCAVVALYALGLLDTGDMSKIDWASLLMFGGGLSLGAAIDSSGLGAYLGGLLVGFVTGQATLLLYVSILAFTVILTLSASNTATAALIVPVMIPLAKALGLGVKQLSVLAGIGTSLDFILPVGTPPSAISYSTGYITTWDMAKAGLVVTTAGILLLALMAWLYW